LPKKGVSKEEAALILSTSDNEEEVVNTLLYVCFNYDDWEWVQDKCLELLEYNNENICGLAITCLGHIARIHSTIDKKKVLGKLQNKMGDERFAGRIEDALDDIHIFVK